MVHHMLKYWELSPLFMSIRISRHEQRQMKWRKITEAEVESTIADPDMQQDSIRGRKTPLRHWGTVW